MNKQYKSNLAQPYLNNHCTEASVQFIPHICSGQCVHDCDDAGQGCYDSLDEWVSEQIGTINLDELEEVVL